MIDRLEGKVLARTESRVVVSIGGVGFGVNVPQRAVGAIHVGDVVTLFTVMIVREDDISLYGFLDEAAKTTFEILRGVSGVGPKLALAVLGDLSVEEIARAVADENFATFKAVSGVGPKTAKLITVSLAGRFDDVTRALVPDGNQEQPPATVDEYRTVVQGLVGLGWDERQAASVVKEVAGASSGRSESAILRESLRRLGSTISVSTLAAGAIQHREEGASS